MSEMRRYIVCDGEGPLVLSHYEDTPRGGVLLHGDVATVFSDSSARRAIARSRRYAKARSYPWDANYRVWLLKGR